MVEMELTRILIAETRDGQIIVLKEKNGTRAFPIVIGYFEAAAIDRHVKEQPMARPLTHDLLTSVIKAFGGTLERVVINDLRDNTFYGRLIIKRDGETLDVDSRPSDAIALAVQNSAPIFVEEHVLDEVCSSGSIDLSELDLNLDEEGEEEEEDEGEKGQDEPKG
jgi:uncharacterized protein